MCGIAFIMRKDGRPAIKQLIKTYEKQKTRGQLGFGYVASTNGEIESVDRSSEEKEIYKSLKGLTSEMVMFHHRMPTSTPNFAEGAHPIYVSNPRLKYDYYVVHNGVIRNDDYLKGQHEKLGYKYTTEMTMEKSEKWVTRDRVYETPKSKDETKFNDSESLAIELAEGIEKDSEKIEAYGSIAFIAYQTTKDDGDNVIKIENIYYGRNTNPLKIEDNNNFLKLSSEGNGEEIESHILYKFNLAEYKVYERKCVFGAEYVPTYKEGSYKDGKWVDKKGDDYDDDGYYGVGFRTGGRGSHDVDGVKIPKIFDNLDVDKYLDERYWDKRNRDIEQELEDRDYDYEPFLTGEETVQELEALMKNIQLKHTEALSKGLTQIAQDYETFMLEVEYALEDWEEALKDDTDVEGRKLLDEPKK